MSSADAIAIVGAGARLPGAPDTAAFWDNLRAGRDTVSRFDAGALHAAGVPEDLARHADYVPARGVLPDGERFDWEFFGYSPAEARLIDPQQRVFLEICWATLSDAGLDPARFPGWIGVFAGCDVAAGGPPGPDDGELMSRLVGAEKDFLATRVAYKLRLRGPAITVQTACSTSLVAVHQACQSLLGYECDAALAGGVSLWLPQASGYLHQEGHILSVDGRCRSFDAAATGTVSSNGAGAVLLRRLDDALADGDRVMAVLRGSAVNNDGGEKIGYTAPSLTGQRDVIRLALAQADVDPSDVSHVEAHGTATQVGDPVEVAALTAAFRAGTDRTGYCWLSSVKSNIGHTGAAAGVAGLIKTALLLEHRELVPSVHFQRANPKLELDQSPFRVVTGTLPLPPEGPVLAGVSSFGVGGTNAHAVLEAPPRPAAGRGPRLFCLSAPTAGTLRRARTALAERITRRPAPDPVSVAWTLAGRPALPHRVAVTAEDLDEAAAALRDETGHPGLTGAPAAGVAFVFPGQGALYPGAAEAAYQLLPVFRELFDEACAHAHRAWGLDLRGALRADAPAEPLRESLAQQVGLFAIGYCLGRQLLAWGVRPVAMLGHSAGEYVAAALAGIWDLPAGLEVVAQRALAMRQGPPGRMLAVYAPPDEVTGLVAGRELAVATEGPGQVVLAGPAEEIERLHAELADEQVTGVSSTLLDADRPFHTEPMRGTTAALRTALGRHRPGVAELPVVSNLTGELVPPERLGDPDYWSDHLCRPVRLTAGMRTLLAAGPDLVVELGPGQTMTGGLRRHPDWDDACHAVPLLGRDREPRRQTLLAALGRLWSAGVPLDWDSLFTTPPTRCSLPPVPLDSKPCPAPSRPTTEPGDAPAATAGLVVVGADTVRVGRLAERLAAEGVPVTATLTEDPDPERAPAPEPAAEPAAGPAAEPAAAALAGALDLPAPGGGRLSGRPDLAAALREYCAGLAGRAVRDTAGLAGNGRSTAAGLAARLDPERRLPRLADQLVTLLVDQGWLAGAGDELTLAPDIDARVTAALARAADLDDLAGLRQLLEHCADAWPEVFAGRVAPVEVLYPDGSGAFLRGCLADNRVAIGDGEQCLDALVRALPAWHAARAGRPARILEIGAGRGELTWRLCEAWPDRAGVTYHVTDISPLLVSELDRRAADRREPDLHARRFDMTADPVAQGMVPGSYDLILGYNVVHVAPSVPWALANLGRLLHRDGALCLVELTSADPWTHLVWGLAPGWWDFADELRTGSPHLDLPGWRGALAGAGFDCVPAGPSAGTDHAVLVASLAGRERLRQPVAEIGRQSAGSPAPAVSPAALPEPAAPPRPADAQVRHPDAQPRPGAAAGDRPPEAGDPLTATLRELWCGVLGVSSAAPADDFYALGGESLALVHLLGRVREQTGVAVATAELAVAPTFGSLVDLVRRAAAQPPAPAPAGSPNLLPLHEAGEHDPDSRPLFLAAPGAGSTLCYRRLAPLVGDRRHPVYGLESPGLHDGAEPLRRFEEMARENLRLVREVQPRGPYRLGGWSVGAMVAHEMAAQLTAAGERVEPLLCIDGFVPRTRGRPIGARPGYLARGMWYQAQTALPFVRARNLGAALGLAGLTGDNGFTGDGRPTDGGAPGGDRRITDLGAQFVRVYQANVRAMLRYVPAPVDCAAVIFKTGLTGRTRRRVQREASASYRRGVRVVGVPGDHWSVLDRRFVADLATQIRAVLEP